jgi:sugar lactone lactonase YvrE
MSNAGAPHIRKLIDLPLGVGESPVWDDRLGKLYFVDITAPAVFRFTPGTDGLERWDMPSAIGSLGLCTDGRLIVALRNGVHFFDPRNGRFEFLVNPEPDMPGNRLNDGKVGPDGAFWVGSMDDRPDKSPIAALYRVTADGRSARVVDGLVVSNGLAWSADGRTMWHSDSRQRFISAYDFDATTGSISNHRTIRTMTDAEGRPDGAAGDAEGYCWSAGVSAGVLNRVAPDGTIERQVPLPCPAPTMPCFGGKDLRTVYVTSLTRPDGVPGSLHELDLGVAGAPVSRFG